MQREDLEAAVAASVIDAESAGRLIVFLERRRGEMVETPGDEGVRFARDFHDVFIAIGVVLLGVAALIALEFLSPPDPYSTAIVAALEAGGFWLLAEYLVRKRRLWLTSIIVTIVFVYLTGLAINIFMIAYNIFPLQADSDAVLRTMLGDNYISLATAFGSALGSAAFLLRFRVPFAAATLAASSVASAFFILATWQPELIGQYVFHFLFASGLAVFACAVVLDVSDPHRRSLRTDMAFWLHLLAAPMMVHGLIMITVGGLPQTPGDAVLVIGLVVILALVAVVLDRRAPLVSVLGYFGVALNQIFGSSQGSGSDAVIVATLVALGAFIVLLGTGWRATRRAVLTVVPLPVRLRTLSPLPDSAL
ncbi:hypothetical protein [Methylobrevis albus]|uniref:DUF2157 domain-containing protein n=1 Tax=Methylobrevis albus TaxID=2793297 RepID=A0A931MXD3_9HYPH|nr:hypothetical protein [Methylobrevis albus]MBH0238853.1 hypothetical protein [Methylobrevis albus]